MKAEPSQNAKKDIRFRTNFATKPNPSDAGASETADPMESMVELPSGGYNLAKFVGGNNNREYESGVPLDSRHIKNYYGQA